MTHRRPLLNRGRRAAAYRECMHPLNPGPELVDALDPYLRVDRTRRVGECWVTAHMVGGLDGSAAIAGRVGALSTGPDAALFRRMRQIADVVLVGAETVRREGYGPVHLSAEAQDAREAEGRAANPPLAIVSRSLELPWESRAFKDAPADARTVVVTCASADADRVARAREVADVVIAGEDRVEPARAMAELARLGHRVVLCEGGPRWLGEVVAADLLDELLLSISPVMGGDPLPVSVAPAGAPLRGYALRHVLREDDTLFLRYERAQAGSNGH